MKSPVLSALFGLVLVLSLSDRDWRAATLAVLLITCQLPAQRRGEPVWSRALRIGVAVGAAALVVSWLVSVP
ncbi:hypothetical protein GCM10011584_14100 [Nocardioides phosphati]|uniref:Uncharacterized protein n=1 Tax=Nocardioides phosphati TaxID=1867775 RepID=A0ABQ2N9V7_9ACTN|nr:hypothetical protein [Nocardioides phosphati]GGO88036.1 hypothetical protein GCM10011584_14100 [Nocardioides phosphati]